MTPEELAAIYPRAGWAKGRAQQIVDDFHRLFYDTERHAAVTWMGHEMWKYPTDVLVYAEIIHKMRPATILECGTFHGGSALFFADMLHILGRGHVVSVDIWDDREAGHRRPRNSKITYVRGSSIDPEIVEKVRTMVALPALLILDSDHTAPHVVEELRAYGDLAEVIIVEDTNLGHEVLPAWGPGPAEAVDEWLAENPDWYVDRDMERLLLTCAPGGFLRRKDGT